MRLRSVAALSFLFTSLFFFEYLPPIRWVDIPYDLHGYHYPLADFAFRSLQLGQVPEWDPTMYCGMSFSGNPQPALFYPPMWLVFIANIGHARIRYITLEIFVLAHVWLGFLFCFLWLRHKNFHELACLLGAGVFAYSGYLLLQLQHLGLVCGYVWLPVGLWSIDSAVASGGWRPLWKLACASALCFLAGYPPTFVVFCVCMLSYAAFEPERLKAILWTGAALAVSLVLAMVQLLPAVEVLGQKIVSPAYGVGVRRPDFYISYFIPNYFDFGLHTPIYTNPGGEYLYLGAPAFFGILWLMFDRRTLRAQLPILAVGVLALVFVSNPFGLVWNLIRHSNLLAQIVRSWYFLAGVTLSAAGLAAAGLNSFLLRDSRPTPRWLNPLALGLLGAWSAREIWIWIPGGSKFSSGWRGAIDPLVMLALFAFSIVVVRGEKGLRRACLAAALLVAVGVDYKVFGTSKRVNAMELNIDRVMSIGLLPGMADSAYREIRGHPEYRVALDASDPNPAELRHYGLTTPQGEDPLAPAQYLTGVIPPRDRQGVTQWSILIDPTEEELLQLLGVRYFITTDGQPLFERLRADRDYRAVPPLDYYFKVFEFSKAQPMYRWPGQVLSTAWEPKRRDFKLNSSIGGQFILTEELLPGWRAAVDGQAVSVELWNGAFQSVKVPQGNHTLSFSFHAPGLRLGAVVSLVSIAALVLIVGLPRNRTAVRGAERKTEG